MRLFNVPMSQNKFSAISSDISDTVEPYEGDTNASSEASQTFILPILLILLALSIFMMKRKIRHKDFLLQGRWLIGSKTHEESRYQEG